MSKRESKTDPPVPQIVGFHVDKQAERQGGDETEEQEKLSESSVPFLPPSKEPPKDARQADVLFPLCYQTPSSTVILSR
jgi:hypothetical protein